MKPKKRLNWLMPVIIGVILFIAVSIGLVMFVYPKTQRSSETQESPGALSPKKDTTEIIDEIKSMISSVQGTIGVAVHELKYKRDFGINTNELFPSASTRKIPIAMAAYSEAEKGSLSLDENLTLTEEDIVAGSTYSIRELIRLMIIESDNTAANMVIDRLGLDLINNFVKEMGASNTYNAGKFMIPAPTDSETTPADMCKILNNLQNDKTLSSEDSNEIISIMKQSIYKDVIAGEIPEDIVANKRGEYYVSESDNVEGDIGIVYLEGNPYIISIFAKGLSQDEDYNISILADISKKIYDFESENIQDFIFSFLHASCIMMV